MKQYQKNNATSEGATVNTAEVLFTCAFIPIILRAGHDPETDDDRIMLAIKLGKRAAHLMAKHSAQ